MYNVIPRSAKSAWIVYNTRSGWIAINSKLDLIYDLTEAEAVLIRLTGNLPLRLREEEKK